MKKLWCLVLIAIGAALLIAAAPNSEPETLYLYERNGLYGYMNQCGYIVIRPQFTAALQFREGLAAISRTAENTVEYINEKGVPVISNHKFYINWSTGCRSFHNKIAIVATEPNKPSGCILIDQTGDLITNHVFRDNVSDFNEGYACYSTGYAGFPPQPGYERMVKYSYLNTSGETATEQWFDEARDFSNGLAIVGRWKDGDIQFVSGDKRFAVIDRDFQFVTDYRFEEAGSYHDGLLPVMAGGKWGYIDGQGNQVIACRYDSDDWFGDRIRFNQLRPYLRDADWKGAHDFSEGLAAVYQDGKWGYIDTSGAMVIPPQFEYARPFSEGLAAVIQDGKWGFIDQTGKIAIPAQYAFVLNFQDGLAVVSDSDGKYKYYINKTGQVIRLRAKRS